MASNRPNNDDRADVTDTMQGEMGVDDEWSHKGSRVSNKQKAMPSPHSKPQAQPSPQSKPQAQPSPHGKPQPATTPCKDQHLFPQRPGINWQIGTRIEAMDFLEKWYPAKITDIDEEDFMVLIHFEGWNQRYDEWLHMNSEKIRPLTRHSGRKEKKKGHVRSEHKSGDLVYAKWTDCKIYPAKITSINSDGSYEVLFYDGFNKTIQPINVRAMPAKNQAELLKQSEILSSKGYKTMKAAMKSSPDSGPSKVSPSTGQSPQLEKKEHPDIIQRKRKRIRPKGQEKGKVLKTKSKQTKSCMGLKFSKKRKLLVGGAFSFHAKKRVVEDKESPPAKRVKRKIKTKDSETDSPSPKKKMKKDTNKEAAEETDTTSTGDSSFESPVSRGSASSQSRGSVSSQSRGSVSSQSRGSLSAQMSPVDSPAPAPPPPPAKLPVKLPSKPPIKAKKCVRSQSDKGPVTSPLVEPAAKETPPASTRRQSESVPEKAVASKEFKVEDDHNHFKCPFEGCNKSFRKESLVEYHIKYYHAEDGQLIPPPQPRTRKKTTSICSNDSDISVTTPKTVSKKKRGSLTTGQQEVTNTPSSTAPPPVKPLPSAKSLPAAVQESTSEVNEEVAASSSVTENSDQKGALLAEEHVDVLEETEEETETNKDEVVSCICQFSEENGLMIQCDICLCWQHAVCCDITEETLPKKYVCYVCQNPPGLRESARYIYNQDWLQAGQMAQFRFLQNQQHEEETDQSVESRRSTHDLISDLHSIKRVLNSINCSIAVLKDQEQFSSELNVWTKNWTAELQLENQASRKMESESEAVACDYMAAMMTSESQQDTDVEEHINVVDLSTDIVIDMPRSQGEGQLCEGQMGTGEDHSQTPEQMEACSSDKQAETLQQDREENTTSEMSATKDSQEKADLCVEKENLNMDGQNAESKSSSSKKVSLNIKSESSSSHAEAEDIKSESSSSQKSVQNVESDSSSTQKDSQNIENESSASLKVAQNTESESSASQTSAPNIEQESTVSLNKEDSPEKSDLKNEGEKQTENQREGTVESAQETGQTATQTAADQPRLDETSQTATQTAADQPRLDYTGSDSTTDTASESESHLSPPATKSQQVKGRENPPGQHDYTLSLTPSAVKLTGSSLWKQVNKTSDVADESETPTAEDEEEEEEEDYARCEQNLLSHVLNMQDELALRMDVLEHQISELEESSGVGVPDMLLSDVPQVKKSLQTLLRDLDKVRRMSMFHIP